MRYWWIWTNNKSLCYCSLISAPLLTRSTKYGVSQGFCLGPAFVLDSHRLWMFYDNQSPLAFDTLLYRWHAIVSWVQTGRHCCPGYCCLSYEGMLRDIRQWMIKDKFMINDEKTALWWLELRHSGHESVIIPNDEAIRNLAVWLQSTFSICSHVPRTCKSSFSTTFTK